MGVITIVVIHVWRIVREVALRMGVKDVVAELVQVRAVTVVLKEYT